jgi:hypothetical protein
VEEAREGSWRGSQGFLPVTLRREQSTRGRCQRLCRALIGWLISQWVQSRLQSTPSLDGPLRTYRFSHTTPYLTTPKRPPRHPSLRAASSWTVSTPSCDFLPASLALVDARKKSASPASLKSIDPITNPCHCIQEHAQDTYYRSVLRFERSSASSIDHSTTAGPLQSHTAQPPFFITRPSTIDPIHQTSIEEVLPLITGCFLVHLSRVVLLCSTHPLLPAGPMRISRYHADYPSQPRPS